MDRRFMLMKKNVPRGLSAPAPGHIHAYDHNIQTSCSWKLCSQSKTIFMWSIVRNEE